MFLEPLTPRQQEVLRLLATGMTYGEVAQRLILSERTIQTHVRNMLVRLGVRNKMAAIPMALKHGYLNLDDVVQAIEEEEVTSG